MLEDWELRSRPLSSRSRIDLCHVGPHQNAAPRRSWATSMATLWHRTGVESVSAVHSAIGGGDQLYCSTNRLFESPALASLPLPGSRSTPGRVENVLVVQRHPLHLVEGPDALH